MSAAAILMSILGSFVLGMTYGTWRNREAEHEEPDGDPDVSECLS